ncbi:ATP-binding protein [bacterium]|nr:ATP-binding protein [bacterium]MDB4657595.1 ATP-binding protein [Verrucomicrobiales bacterium]MDC0259052.1 ATP-binding protein [Verrucomicrobiales bacterium]MDC0276349.1 ATP-binding protein [Verrucomicrobiales bacterium]MDC0322524.1 ATP-binding protein [Verrucomicrobiales bacterium]
MKSGSQKLEKPLPLKSSPQPEAISILCIEDNDGDFLIMEGQLESTNSRQKFNLCRARTAKEALTLISERSTKSSNGSERDLTFDLPFDLIFLDLSLPDSVGVDTYELIANEVPHVPIIVLSGSTDRDLALEMVQRGAQDYLPKDHIFPEMLLRSVLYSIERQKDLNSLEKLNLKLEATTEKLKSAQMQLIQAEKLDSLGRLAAGVAHEVRNPLGALRMGISYLKQREANVDDPSFQFVFKEMDTAIVRADSIIQGMLDYSRDDSVSLKAVNPNQLIETALSLVQYEITTHKVEVKKSLLPKLPNILVDASKMEHVFINLFSNAIQAMADEGGKLEITTQCGIVDEIKRDEGVRDFVRIRKQDEVVLIEIRDHGPGIPVDKVDRIFEPFFTTKPTGEGTGLGLSIVKRIVDLHRGHIRIRNCEDSPGACVSLYFKAITS